MSVEDLYRRVTIAIERAESLEDAGETADARAAYYDVPTLEEEIAASLPPTSADGQVARDGAVRAALSAGLFARAWDLAEKYEADVHFSASLVQAFRAMRAQAERELATLGETRIFPEARVQFPDAA